MSKAILIMDMPKNCFQCKLWHTVEDDNLCGVTFKTINPFADEPPDWCPIIDIDEADDLNNITRPGRKFQEKIDKENEEYLNSLEENINE